MERIQIIIVNKSLYISRHVLVMYVFCGSVARTVFVFLNTGSMKYRGLRVFVWVWGVWVWGIFFFGGGGALVIVFVLLPLRMKGILIPVLSSVLKEEY